MVLPSKQSLTGDRYTVGMWNSEMSVSHAGLVGQSHYRQLGYRALL